MQTAAASSSAARDVFITGLKNVHAIEVQASQIGGRQVERLENYPALRARLEQHMRETDAQMRRVEQVLRQMGDSPSALKDAVTGFMGNMAALAHAPAGDEVLKNLFADYAFESYEIASYRSLIAMAEEVMPDAVPALRESLSEEESMSSWLGEHIEDITRQYTARTAMGQKADR